jgi:hypothetical protein
MSSNRHYWISLATTIATLGLCNAQADIRSTIQAAKSGTTVTCSGSYSVSAKITVPSGVTVKGGTFNFSNSSDDGFYVASGSSGVTLSGITVKGANHGIMIYGSSCKITSCTACGNHNSGIEIIGTSAKNNTISGCVSYNNADSSGGNADGFAAKNSTSTGNKFTSCTAYSNSDDGYDYYSASSPITTSSCQAYSNGSYGGKTGNGDGFKMGGSGYSASHTYTSCVAHNNTAGSTGSGFDSNNNGAKLYLTTCHSYSNKQADRLVNCSLSSCTMQQ